MSPKKYLGLFCIITFIILAIIAVTNYIVDPFMQYRVKDGKYILNPRFVNPGLLKNYDYDLLVMGSSMVQLLDMDLLRTKIPSKPLKIASGDMNTKELELLFSLASKEKTNTFIINLDIHKFFEQIEENRYSEYLYEDGWINDLKYLTSYEANKLTPVDLLLSKYIDGENEISPKIYYRTHIDKIGDFRLDLNFARYNVKRDYCIRQKPDTKDIYHRMVHRFEEFVSNMRLQEYTDKEFIFLLPPYSAVYWHAAKEDGYYAELIDFVDYVVNKLSPYDNIRVVCLYDSDFIVEVKTYADMVHYSPVRVEFIINALANKADDIDAYNLHTKINRLDSLVSKFEVEHADWLKCDGNYY